MARVLNPIVIKRSPSAVLPERRVIRFRLLREGEETSAEKEVRVYRDARGLSPLAYFRTNGGVYTAAQDFQASAIDGARLVMGIDDEIPPRVRAVLFDVSENGDLVLDITNGSGGGGPPTSGATVDVGALLEGAPTNRVIVAIEKPVDGEWRVSGYGTSEDGSLKMDLQVATSSAYLIALDDMGAQFFPSATVGLGHRVRPTLYTGWLYEITEAGTLPATEPQWWPAVGENPSRPLGTARAVAVRYFRPLAHGPVPVERI